MSLLPDKREASLPSRRLCVCDIAHPMGYFGCSHNRHPIAAPHRIQVIAEIRKWILLIAKAMGYFGCSHSRHPIAAAGAFPGAGAAAGAGATASNTRKLPKYENGFY